MLFNHHLFDVFKKGFATDRHTKGLTLILFSVLLPLGIIFIIEGLLGFSLDDKVSQHSLSDKLLFLSASMIYIIVIFPICYFFIKYIVFHVKNLRRK